MHKEEFDKYVAEGAFDKIWSAHQRIECALTDAKRETDSFRHAYEQYHEALVGLEKAGCPCRLVQLPSVYEALVRELLVCRAELLDLKGGAK
jgi:hypothetical protein